MRSKLFENYIYLSIYQVVNFAVPLLIVPFIIKYTGVQNFGNIAFSYAFVNYFSVLTDYGFNMSATRSISIHRKDAERVSTIYSTIMLTKLLFFAVAFLIFLCLLLIPFFQKNYLLHLGSFALVLAQVLMPVWLFQGLEKMKYLAVANTISKLLFAGLIVLFVRKEQDYLYVNLLQGVGGIVAAIACHIFILTKQNIKIVRTSADNIIREIKNGWMVFISAFAVNIYVNSNAFILGFFSTPAQLGYYSIAEKVYFALKQFGNVFSQVIFPQACLLAIQSIDKLQSFLRRVFVPFILSVVTVSAMAFISAEFICNYFLKKVDYQVIVLIRMFCITTIIVAFDIPPFQGLMALNKKKQYGFVLMSGCALNIVLNLSLVRFFGAVGTTTAILLTELFITIGLTVNFNKITSRDKTLVAAV